MAILDKTAVAAEILPQVEILWLFKAEETQVQQHPMELVEIPEVLGTTAPHQQVCLKHSQVVRQGTEGQVAPVGLVEAAAAAEMLPFVIFHIVDVTVFITQKPGLTRPHQAALVEVHLEALELPMVAVAVLDYVMLEIREPKTAMDPEGRQEAVRRQGGCLTHLVLEEVEDVAHQILALLDRAVVVAEVVEAT